MRCPGAPGDAHGGAPTPRARPARSSRGRGALGAPGARSALGARPAAASRGRVKHMDGPGTGTALRAAITAPLMVRINHTAATAPRGRGLRDAPRRRKVFQPPRSARSPAASERGCAASEERGLTWG